MYKRQKGFTLIEMIIVTVIIGILAGTVITVINIPRIQARSRDSRRVGDLKRIQTALELYFADHRAYPVSGSWITFSHSIINIDEVVYMESVPVDPRADSVSGVVCFGSAIGGQNYGYYYRTTPGGLSGGEYVLGTIMELDTATDDSTKCSSVCVGGWGCGNDAQCYCVQNPM